MRVNARRPPQPRTASLFLTTLFLIPLWPEFFSLSIGSAFWISLTRLVLLTTLAIWVAEILGSRIRNPLSIRGTLPKSVVLIFFLCILWKLISGFATLVPYSIATAIIDFIYQFLFLLLAISTLTSPENINRLVRTLLSSAILMSLFVFFEYILQENILLNYVPAGVDDRLLKIATRGDIYRCRGMFSNPLALASFCSLVLPLSIWVIKFSKGTDRFLGATATASMAFAIFATMSRAAIGVTALTILGYTVNTLFTSMRRSKSLQGAMFRFVLLVAALSCGILATAFLADRLIVGSGEKDEQDSNEIRLVQLAVGIPKILDQPLLGYGPGQASDQMGTWAKVIDNYYLTLTLESGIPTLVLFILTFLVALVLAWRLQSSLPRPWGELSRILFWTIICNMLFMAVLSLKETLPFLFLYIGMVICLAQMHFGTQRTIRDPFVNKPVYRQFQT